MSGTGIAARQSERLSLDPAGALDERNAWPAMPGPSRRLRGPSPRMHIVHVVLSLGLGGQEVLILELCRELARRGERVTVISLRSEEHTSELQSPCNLV